jgi:hypothetical protein
MPAGGKRLGAGRPKGSRALTLLAPTGERMGFYEATPRVSLAARPEKREYLLSLGVIRGIPDKLLRRYEAVTLH